MELFHAIFCLWPPQPIKTMCFKKILFAFTAALFSLAGFSHPMPHSLLLLDVHGDEIRATLNLPLNEFQFVYPTEDFDNGYKTLLQRKGAWLDAYLLQHITISDSTGRLWKITILGKSVSESEQPLSGKYHELTFTLLLTPPPGSSPRNFIMHYDVIMHQLVTHKLFIRISADWYGGMTAKDSLDADLGVLAVNPGDGKIPPVIVKLEKGSTWKGFKTMVQLGMNHITEGTDHLLFLFVLLLPATLVAEKNRWTRFGGTRYSLLRLGKFVTAFTIGHSVSLLLAATKLLTLPGRPVEIAIAVTIFVTAIHAIRPLFFRKEVFIALGFGLVHGLAFAGVLSEMNLSGSRLAWSILGFNIGIELVQLFIVICIVPWVIVLSRNNFYQWLRIAGAVFALIASVGWMVERVAEEPNFVSLFVEKLATGGKYLVAAIALLAAFSLFRKGRFLRQE